MGAIAVMQAVLPIMRERNKGKIMNITSIAGYAGLPFRGMYSATKSALHMVTESLRLELKHTNLQSCTLAPGDVATNIVQGVIIHLSKKAHPTNRSMVLLEKTWMHMLTMVFLPKQWRKQFIKSFKKTN
ncbi:MAG: hypothetical protein CM15mP59_6150 [Flavobacteriaceae bacterium]|nr:MAG: hypothetical protein CM15mP59_6150 [Flavobacteriaceae bacterium]